MNKKSLPVCFWAFYKEKDFCHILKNCTGCPENEKKELLNHLAAEKAVARPSKSTGSQTWLCESTVKQNSKALERNSTSKGKQYSLFHVLLADVDESVLVSESAGNGAGDFNISRVVDVKAVLNAIKIFRKIASGSMQIVLKDGAEGEKFAFSRSRTIPRTILKLSAGPLALLNLEYLFSE